MPPNYLYCSILSRTLDRDLFYFSLLFLLPLTITWMKIIMMYNETLIYIKMCVPWKKLFPWWKYYITTTVATTLSIRHGLNKSVRNRGKTKISNNFIGKRASSIKATKVSTRSQFQIFDSLRQFRKLDFLDLLGNVHVLHCWYGPRWRCW